MMGARHSRILLLLGLLNVGLVCAHNNGEAPDISSDVSIGGVAATTPSKAIATGGATELSYFRYQEHSHLMVAHIVLMTLAWVFVLPLGVMFSITRSRHDLFAHFAFLLIHGCGCLMSTFYKSSVPDLYPHNVHRPLGWGLTWIVAAQACMTLTSSVSRQVMQKRDTFVMCASIPITARALGDHQRAHSLEYGNDYRFSHDSGQGIEPDSDQTSSPESPFIVDNVEHQRALVEQYSHTEHVSNWWGSSIGRYLSDVVKEIVSDPVASRILGAADLLNGVSNRLILILGFVGWTTGIVTYGGIFRGDKIFSGLAHFIKGAVFFWYGILTLGRWAGCFSDRGWAWNLSPGRRLQHSAEFLESFLIFFYGTTNVFLEHLGSWGQAWSAQDLEHLSITIMFIGGGMCGMLIESSAIRNLLNATILQSSNERPPAAYGDEHRDYNTWDAPSSYKFPMNPIPALIVLLLGKVMSGHHQGSMTATMIHAQWGFLLMGAAFARGATYIIFYISPPTSFLPSRPPTELITAFCLMAGGIIFMASNTDTVEAMEANKLNAMFVFTVAVGFVTFLMAWILLVVAIKGWAVGKECHESGAKRLA